jgi:hypothetical protein
MANATLNAGGSNKIITNHLFLKFETLNIGKNLVAANPPEGEVSWQTASGGK